MDWEKFWSDKSDDRYSDQTPEVFAKRGREKLLHLGSGDRLLDIGCENTDAVWTAIDIDGVLY